VNKGIVAEADEDELSRTSVCSSATWVNDEISDSPGEEEAELLAVEGFVMISEGGAVLVVTSKMGSNATPTAGDGISLDEA